MILKKLRVQKGWSQSHLAETAGLSTRTVQRIESGHKASLESLMALASSLEVDISTLRQEITVIDKTTEKWQSHPLFLRILFADSNIAFIGPGTRRNYLRFETLMAVCAILLFVSAVFLPVLAIAGIVLLLISYLCAVAVRLGDKHDIW